MTHSIRDTAATQATELLTQYSFDLGNYQVDELVDHWLTTFPASWLKSALVEALYQGRYKAVSVEQILNFWRRRGQPLYHFNSEFERIICGKSRLGIWSLSADESKPDPNPSSNGAEPTAPPPDSQVNQSAENPPSPPEEPVDRPEELSQTSESLPNGFTASAIGSAVNFGIPASEPIQWVSEAVKHPIHQFVPTQNPSDFYAKLRSVAGGKESPGEAN